MHPVDHSSLRGTMAASPIILRVWVPLLGLQKAVMFDQSVLVADAMKSIAEKCNFAPNGTCQQCCVLFGWWCLILL
jgi:hypothetical protein